MSTEAIRKSDVPFRVALLGGILGSLGATIGWLLWIAIQAVARDWKVVLAPVVGAALGYVIQWVEGYIHTARHERERGAAAEHASEPPAHVPPRGGVRMWALALGFLALACEHLVGHLMSEFLVPFLASMATLFPAGAVFGWLLAGGRGDGESPLMILLQGALLGGAAAVVALLVQVLMGAPVRVEAIFGWWVLVGLGLMICCPQKGPPGPVHAAGGVLVSLVFVLLCSIPGLTLILQKLPPVISIPTVGIASAVDGALRAPDVPAVFWIEAEARAHQHEESSSATGHEESENETPSHSANPAFSLHAQWPPSSGESPFGSAERRPLFGNTPGGGGFGGSPGGFGSINGPSNSPPAFTWPPANAPETGSSPLNAPALNGPGPAAPFGSGGETLNDLLKRSQPLPSLPIPADPNYVRLMREQMADPALERQRILRQELGKGMASGLVRSWIVLLLFALGVGLGPLAERLLRPAGDYSASRTYRNDRLLAASIVVLILAACMVVRLEQREKKGGSAAARSGAATHAECPAQPQPWVPPSA